MEEKEKGANIFVKIFILVISLGASVITTQVEALSLLNWKSFNPGMAFVENDTVSFLVCLGVIVFIVPPIQVLISFFGEDKENIFTIFLDSYLGYSVTFFVGTVVKMVTGKERPDFLDRIKKTSGQTLLEGRRSFPSGHTMMSFAGLFYLAYTSYKTIKTVRNSPIKGIIGYLGVVMPFLLSSFVGYSRIADSRHDIVDVTVGAVMGLIIPYLVNKMIKPNRKKHLIKR